MSRTVGLTFEADTDTNFGIDLSSMTVAELKAYAGEIGIDLNGAIKKDDIISRISEPAEV